MTFFNSLDVPQFTARDAFEAAGIDSETFRNWTSRRQIVAFGRSDRPAGGQGQRHLLTLRRLIYLAVIAALVRVGLPVAKAAQAALQFTDGSPNGGGWAGEGEAGRLPGEHFPEGDTLLVIRPDEEFAKVKNVRNPADLAELVDQDEAVVLVNLTRLELLIRARLGIPGDVERAAEGVTA